jgi:hypothetical protein
MRSSCRTLDGVPTQFRKRPPQAQALSEEEPLAALIEELLEPLAEPSSAQAAADPETQPIKPQAPSMADFLFMAVTMLIMVDGESFLFGR